MILARVTGMVTSSNKDRELANYKLLVVQPLGLDLEADGEEVIAIDRVDAGVGDRVLLMREGNAARQVTGRERIPLQNVVIGVVDRIDWLSSDRSSYNRSTPDRPTYGRAKDTEEPR